MRKLARFLAIGGVALIACAVDTALPAQAVAAPYQFMTGMGTPTSPQPWDNVHQGGWDVLVHTREQLPDENVQPIQAEHGADCAPPPATHLVTTATSSVFICKDHLMTSIADDGFGSIMMSPPRLVDFSAGATIDFNVSTLQMSQGTWIELWITPFGENLALPSDNIPPDLSGPPKDAIHVAINEPTSAGVYEFNNFNQSQVTPTAWQAYSDVLTPTIQSATNRTHFQVQLSRTHVKYGAIGVGGTTTNFTWTDADLPVPLSWSQGVIQLESASYNPTKAGDCETAYTQAFHIACTPDTWHWSNFAISSAVPFTIDHGSPDFVGGSNGNHITFEAASPASGFLRFVARGATQVSYDGGASWQAAQRAAESVGYNDCQFENYWMPIPSGLSGVLLRGQPDCYGQPWTARDVTVWSQSAGSIPAPLPTPSPSPTPSSAPSPSPSATPMPLQHTPCTIQVNGRPVSGFCTGTFSTT